MTPNERHLYEVGNSLGTTITGLLKDAQRYRENYVSDGLDDEFDIYRTFDAHTKIFLLFGAFGYFIARQKVLMFRDETQLVDQEDLLHIVLGGLLADMSLLFHRITTLPQPDTVSDISFNDIITLSDIHAAAFSEEELVADELEKEQAELLDNFISKCDARFWTLSTVELYAVFIYVLKKPLMYMEDIEDFLSLDENVQQYFCYMMDNGIKAVVSDLIFERCNAPCNDATCNTHGFQPEIIKEANRRGD